jgi:hypothetical protein
MNGWAIFGGKEREFDRRDGIGDWGLGILHKETKPTKGDMNHQDTKTRRGRIIFDRMPD